MKIKRLPLFLISLTYIFLCLPNPVQAQLLKNEKYNLQLNTTTQENLEANPATEGKIKTTDIKAPEINSKIIKGDNFIAELSYEDDKKQLPFLFSISSTSIFFGEIEPGEPFLRTQSISVSPGSAKGFQVLAQQDHPLTSSDNAQIPNTSCDSGSCTNILSDSWELPLTYGFGYTCADVTSEACVSSFRSKLYKRFSSLSFNENPSQVLFQSKNDKSESIIEYKLNVSPTQVKRTYSNTINYYFIPNL